MARLRKFVSYRKLERPYTRTSRYKGKAYIRMNPNIKVIGFETGTPRKSFQYTLKLISKKDLQIRENALESAKQTSNKLLEKTIGISEYHLKLKPYPHHVLRENPLAAGAGADRFSTGMQKAFGKPIGSAAQIKKGDEIFNLFVNKPSLEVAKTALSRASKKLPCSCIIQVTENSKL
ncbi:50S ribosomal protein L16 [Candidatus Woesearchaeota archaeon]|nr:50S ribosomal protein L16 [Candidatus Woesearchaeota archaeon]